MSVETVLLILVLNYEWITKLQNFIYNYVYLFLVFKYRQVNTNSEAIFCMRKYFILKIKS